MIALIDGVTIVSQGKIMYQAELEFHVKQQTSQATTILPNQLQIKVVSQTGHNSQKML